MEGQRYAPEDTLQGVGSIYLKAVSKGADGRPKNLSLSGADEEARRGDSSDCHV
jgi:hypothetical protein